jgi:hypothetical protein
MLSRIGANAGGWLPFVAPWEMKAILAGLAFGLLGWWWGRSRSLVAGAAVCLAFIAEPLAWAVYDGHLPRPAAIWVAEAAIGLAALLWLLASRGAARLEA